MKPSTESLCSPKLPPCLQAPLPFPLFALRSSASPPSHIIILLFLSALESHESSLSPCRAKPLQIRSGPLGSLHSPPCWGFCGLMHHLLTSLHSLPASLSLGLALTIAVVPAVYAPSKRKQARIHLWKVERMERLFSESFVQMIFSSVMNCTARNSAPCMT